MGPSFSVWHWVILLLIIGIPVALIIRSSRRKTSSEGAPVGFGGWLLLLAIGQTISPLRTLGEAIKNLESVYDQLMAFPNGQIVLYGEVALAAMVIALQIVTIVLMYRKSRFFRRFFVYQWLTIPAVFVLEVLLVSATLDLPVGLLAAESDPGGTIGAFLVTGLWVWYVFKSVRVRNTFDQAAALKQVFA